MANNIEVGPVGGSCGWVADTGRGRRNKPSPLKVAMYCLPVFKSLLHKRFEAAVTAKSSGHRKTQR